MVLVLTISWASKNKNKHTYFSFVFVAVLSLLLVVLSCIITITTGDVHARTTCAHINCQGRIIFVSSSSVVLLLVLFWVLVFVAVLLLWCACLPAASTTTSWCERREAWCQAWGMRGNSACLGLVRITMSHQHWPLLRIDILSLVETLLCIWTFFHNRLLLSSLASTIGVRRSYIVVSRVCAATLSQI